MIQSGYTQGHFDKRKNAVIPVSRKEILKKEIGSHETVEFHQLIGKEYPIDVVVDLNFATSWKFVGDNITLDVEELLKNKYMYNFGDVCLPGPNPEFLFIHTCLHH